MNETLNKKDSKRKKIVFGIVFLFVILFIIIIAATWYDNSKKEKKPDNDIKIENYYNYDYKYVVQTYFGADTFIYLLNDNSVKVVTKTPVVENCIEGNNCLNTTGEFQYDEESIAFSEKSMNKVREFITSLFKNKRTKFLLLDRKELSKEEERIELAILLNSEDIVTFQEDLIFEEKTKQLKNSTGKVIFEMSKTTIASSNNQIVNNIANYLNSIVEKEWSLLEQDCSEMLAAGGSFEGKDLIEFSLVMEDLGASNLSFTYSMAGTFNSTVRWEKKGFVFNVANGEIYEYPGGKKVTDKVVEEFKKSENYKNIKASLKENWEEILDNTIYTPGYWYIKEDKIHFLISEELLSDSPIKGHVIEVEIENPLVD